MLLYTVIMLQQVGLLACRAVGHSHNPTYRSQVSSIFHGDRIYIGAETPIAAGTGERPDNIAVITNVDNKAL